MRNRENLAREETRGGREGGGPRSKGDNNGRAERHGGQ